MMHIEHYIKRLYDMDIQSKLTLTEFERQFIHDMFFGIVHTQKSLTTKQVDLAIKIMCNYKQNIKDDKFVEVITNKICHNKPIPSINIPREVRYVGNGVFAFRFKYDTKVKNFISKLKDAHWDHTNKVWIVRSNNQSELFNFIANFGFEPDETVLEFFAEQDELQKTEITMLDDDNIFIRTKDLLSIEFFELMELEE